jgi:uncharacterized membrane protein YkvA (DUF1232 family)
LSWLKEWPRRVERLKVETFALYLAYKDPRVPWHARLFAALVVAYALSPIDLIPDFIPVLGYLDDLVLVPLGTLVAIRLIPAAVLDECRAQARAEIRPGNAIGRRAALVVGLTWLIAIILVAVWLSRLLS